MSDFSSSFKRTANSPRRFDKPWQNMETLQNQARRLVNKKSIYLYVYSLKPKNINTDLLSSDSLILIFWAQIHREDPQKYRSTFGLSDKHFSKQNSFTKKHRITCGLKNSQDFLFLKRTPVYSLEGLQLGKPFFIYINSVFSWKLAMKAKTLKCSTFNVSWGKWSCEEMLSWTVYEKTFVQKVWKSCSAFWNMN